MNSKLCGKNSSGALHWHARAQHIQKSNTNEQKRGLAKEQHLWRQRCLCCGMQLHKAKLPGPSNRSQKITCPYTRLNPLATGSHGTTTTPCNRQQLLSKRCSLHRFQRVVLLQTYNATTRMLPDLSRPSEVHILPSVTQASRPSCTPWCRLPPAVSQAAPSGTGPLQLHLWREGRWQGTA